MIIKLSDDCMTPYHAKLIRFITLGRTILNTQDSNSDILCTVNINSTPFIDCKDNDLCFDSINDDLMLYAKGGGSEYCDGNFGGPLVFLITK